MGILRDGSHSNQSVRVFHICIRRKKAANLGVQVWTMELGREVEFPESVSGC